MSEGNSLINFGDLSKPVTTLIEKIADATGVFYEPRRIRNLAKAEAEVDLIKAQAQIEITDLQRRALTRFVQEEAKKQENIENITEGAIPLLNEDSTPENINEDWLANFFDKCRIVSDEEMQRLWSKILAGEANEPNSFSKRTVNFLATLDKTDAELFTTLCSFCVNEIDTDEQENVPLIFDLNDQTCLDCGLKFSILNHLNSIGLITFDGLSEFARIFDSKIVEWKYFESVIQIKFTKDVEKKLPVGKVLLTRIGIELAKICIAKPIEGFADYIIENLKTEPNIDIISSFKSES